MRAIPTYLDEHAHQLTLLRLEQNKKRYEGTHKERTGTLVSKVLGHTSRAYYTEYLGILAELIIRDILDRDVEVSHYRVSTIIKSAEYVSNDCDIEYTKNWDTKRISVKGCEGSLKANKQAIDSEDASSVVFVRFLDKDFCEILKFSPEEIKKWNTNKSFSEYYENQLI